MYTVSLVAHQNYFEQFQIESFDMLHLWEPSKSWPSENNKSKHPDFLVFVKTKIDRKLCMSVFQIVIVPLQVCH